LGKAVTVFVRHSRPYPVEAVGGGDSSQKKPEKLLSVYVCGMRRRKAVRPLIAAWGTETCGDDERGTYDETVDLGKKLGDS